MVPYALNEGDVGPENNLDREVLDFREGAFGLLLPDQGAHARRHRIAFRSRAYQRVG
jgi:hypothetical protein